MIDVEQFLRKPCRKDILKALKDHTSATKEVLRQLEINGDKVIESLAKESRH